MCLVDFREQHHAAHLRPPLGVTWSIQTSMASAEASKLIQVAFSDRPALAIKVQEVAGMFVC